MPGLMSSVRMPRVKSRWPRFSASVRLPSSNDPAGEREYRRMVARGHVRREFDAPFYREVPARRWSR